MDAAGAEHKGKRVAEASEPETPVAHRDSLVVDGGTTTATEEDVALGRNEDEEGLRLVGAGIAARGTQTDGALRPLVAERLVLAPVDDSDHAGASFCP